MINWSLIKYENKIIKYIDMLKNKTFISVFINCLLMHIDDGKMLCKGWIDYLLMLN